MAKKTKTKTPESEPAPKPDLDGPPVPITKEIRERWKNRREELKKANGSDFATRAFGKSVGVSSGTVSNVERGSQDSLPRRVYLKWERKLFGTADLPAPVLEQLADLFVKATPAQAARLLRVAAAMEQDPQE